MKHWQSLCYPFFCWLPVQFIPPLPTPPPTSSMSDSVSALLSVSGSYLGRGTLFQCLLFSLFRSLLHLCRLVVPNKGYSSLDQSPDEKPLVALDTDSDDDFDMSRYSSSGYSSAEQINQDLNIQLLKDGYRLDEIPDDEDLDLIPPKSVNPTCMCCQATSSTTCHIQ